MNVDCSVVEVGNVGSDGLLRDSGSILDDDHDRTVTESPSISINLETSEVPFQQSVPRSLPAEPATRGWRATVAEVGRWPLIALGVAAVLVIVFAAFISRNGQSLNGDANPPDPLVAVEVLSAPPAERNAGSSTQADPGVGSPADSADGTGRSTGTLGPGEAAGFFSGQIVEPDRALTGDDVDWTPTTTTVATTASTASTASSTTLASSTTVQEPSTTVPSGPWVRPIAPGSPDGSKPARLEAKRATLELESSDDDLRYRFMVYLQTNDGDWRLVDRSGWRRDPTWTIKVGRYDGRTVRWTAIGRTGSRDLTEESAPLYFSVGDEPEPEPEPQPEPDDDEQEDVETSLANGGFEQGVGGFDTYRNYGNGAIAGWSSSSGQFEVWASGFEGVNAASGSYFIELNAASPTTITQRVKVEPGGELIWSLQHRSRSGGRERVEVSISPGSESARLSVSGGRWQRHQGTFEVPDGVDTVDFSIRALDGGSVGNFIDDVSVRADD